jgi:DNA-binding GntR family transcriptional regulator
MLNFDSHSHRPLREIVYEELKMQILTGKITPGTRMMEVELAESMGVSRTPVREAIKKLEQEGLVTVEPRKGAYASQISVKDMVDILEVRQDMEGLAAHMAAYRMTPKQMKELEVISAEYNKAVEASNMADMIKYDTAFHNLIVESCDNSILTMMINQLQELLLRFRYVYYDNISRVEKMPSEHSMIMEAIKDGRSDAARASAEMHIERIKEMVMNDGIRQDF